MPVFTPLVDEMVKALCCLPGVGAKSAQRMTLHLLERDRQGGSRLSAVLENAMAHVTSCTLCRNLCETEVCAVCHDSSRDNELLCVVETPADLVSIEQAGGYRGKYFVLSGRLSPIDGVGPDELGIDLLMQRLKTENLSEVIVATNPTVEGEATAHYLIDQIKSVGVTVSRIAHGVPMGGELEYIDSGTLAYALEGRKTC